MKSRRRLAIAARVRTIGFLLAMIPMIAAVTVLCFMSLVFLSPVMAYALIHGKHLKDPWKKPPVSPD